MRDASTSKAGNRNQIPSDEPLNAAPVWQSLEDIIPGRSSPESECLEGQQVCTRCESGKSVSRKRAKGSTLGLKLREEVQNRDISAPPPKGLISSKYF